VEPKGEPIFRFVSTQSSGLAPPFLKVDKVDKVGKVEWIN